MAVKMITGHEPALVKAMRNKGILPDFCRRVIIDITVDDIVTIYFETSADERLLEIDLAGILEGIVNKNKEEASSG